MREIDRFQIEDDKGERYTIVRYADVGRIPHLETQEGLPVSRRELAGEQVFEIINPGPGPKIIRARRV
jgi:hypothetical protein